MKEKLIEIFKYDIDVIYYSLFSWFKKTDLNDKGIFTYHKTSSAKPFTIVVIILASVEIVILHYLIQLWNDTFAWVFTFINIYVLLIIISSYKSMSFLPHELKDDYLIIRKGNIESVQIKLDNIETINKAKWKTFGEKVPKDVHYFVNSFDSPHYEIILKNSVQMKGFYGTRKIISRAIIRLDQPDEFLEEISFKMSNCNSR